MNIWLSKQIINPLIITAIMGTHSFIHGLTLEMRNLTDGQIKISMHRLSDQLNDYPIEFTMEKQTCLVSRSYLRLPVTITATSGSAKGTALALKLPKQIERTRLPRIALIIKNGPTNNQLEFISEPADFFERR